MHYLENTTDEQALEAKSERIRRIHNRVCEVRSSEEVGVKYMQAWEEKYYEREEAREEGREQGRLIGRDEGELLKLIELVRKKWRKGKTLDVIAEELEETTDALEKIYGVVSAHADLTAEEVLRILG